MDFNDENILISLNKYFTLYFKVLLTMENNSKSVEDLQTIRKIMEESTRFLSLSGLSGIFAGSFAIAGAMAANIIIRNLSGVTPKEFFGNHSPELAGAVGFQLIILAALILIFSILFSLYFSIRKAKKEGKNSWSPVSKRLLVSLLTPLITGGLFIIVLIVRSQVQLIIPCMLIFYGLALVSAGKFTYGEVFYLGLIEVIIGLIPAAFPSMALVSWIVGFGVLHLVYGFIMYRKYEV